MLCRHACFVLWLYLLWSSLLFLSSHLFDLRHYINHVWETTVFFIWVINIIKILDPCVIISLDDYWLGLTDNMRHSNRKPVLISLNTIFMDSWSRSRLLQKDFYKDNLKLRYSAVYNSFIWLYRKGHLEHPAWIRSGYCIDPRGCHYFRSVQSSQSIKSAYCRFA